MEEEDPFMNSEGDAVCDEDSSDFDVEDELDKLMDMYEGGDLDEQQLPPTDLEANQSFLEAMAAVSDHDEVPSGDAGSESAVSSNLDDSSMSSSNSDSDVSDVDYNSDDYQSIEGMNFESGGDDERLAEPLEGLEGRPGVSFDEQPPDSAAMAEPEAPCAEAPRVDAVASVSARLRRGEALDRWDVPGGFIRYRRDSGHVCAHCTDVRHGGAGKCRKTRTLFAGARLGQGRPMGHLVAWLAEAQNHEEKDGHFGYVPDLATRIAARQSVKDLPDGGELLDLEATRAVGEDSEPEHVL